MIPNISDKSFTNSDIYSLARIHFLLNKECFPNIISLNNLNNKIIDYLLEKKKYKVYWSNLSIGENAEDDDFLDFLPFSSGKKSRSFSKVYSEYSDLCLVDGNNPDTIFVLRGDENGLWDVNCYYYSKSEKKVEEICKYASKNFISKNKTNRVSLLLKDFGSLKLKSFDLKVPDLNLELNYGKEFLKHDKNICAALNEIGPYVYIFEGEPGTGKSFYIKHLTTKIDREFIYLPNDFVSAMESPDLLSLLLTKKNAVIILEDAEKVVLSRGPDNSSLVSTILNLSDGILGSLLNISFIITYNNIKNLDIDQAILRKGRLKYKYEFGKLSVEDAQKKVDELGFEFKVIEPMSLADVYNLNNNNGENSDFKGEKRKRIIGFGMGKSLEE